MSAGHTFASLIAKIAKQRSTHEIKVAICCDPQARLAELDTPRRLENLQKLEELKKHLMDLEKQVNLST